MWLVREFYPIFLLASRHTSYSLAQTHRQRQADHCVASVLTNNLAMEEWAISINPALGEEADHLEKA